MVMKIPKDMREQVYLEKQAGASLAELAKKYGGEWGISSARISQICKEVRLQKESNLNGNNEDSSN